MDIGKITVWDDLAWRVAHGKHPTDAELASALRECDAPIPADMREYLAGRFDGEVKCPRGRQVSESEKYSRWSRLIGLAVTVRYWQAVYEKCPGPDAPRASALDTVANEHGITAETLRHLIGTELNAAPYWVRCMVPTREQAARYVAEE